MKVTHTFEIEAKCPSMPGHIDRYTCTLTARSRILVETIRQDIAGLLREPVYQEDLAQNIAERLQCGVKLEGEHPGGFKTVVEVG